LPTVAARGDAVVMYGADTTTIFDVSVAVAPPASVNVTVTG
jgi:hypothetical protein